MKHSFTHSDDGLFTEDAHTPRDFSCDDETFAFLSQGPPEGRTLGHLSSSTFRVLFLQFHIRVAVTSRFIVSCRKTEELEDTSQEGSWGFN